MSVNEKMTGIADAIRTKTGGTNKLNLDEMAASINDVFDAGKTAEYDAFWDAFQMNGTKGNYSYAFYEGWNTANYKPKYPIAPTNAQYMYMYSTVEEIGTIDVTNCANCTAMFSTCERLRKVEKLKVSTNITNINNMFRSCEALTDITFEGVFGKSGLNLQWSPLTTESLHSIAVALEDKSTDTSGTAWNITIGNNNMLRLAEEDKQLIKNKGWNCA